MTQHHHDHEYDERDDRPRDDRGGDQRAEMSNTIKDPDDWTTGDEPMTGAQRSYIETLSEEAHEPPPGELSKADASKKIDELQEKTGRGR
jgi:hypothetical protein